MRNKSSVNSANYTIHLVIICTMLILFKQKIFTMRLVWIFLGNAKKSIFLFNFALNWENPSRQDARRMEFPIWIFAPWNSDTFARDVAHQLFTIHCFPNGFVLKMDIQSNLLVYRTPTSPISFVMFGKWKSLCPWRRTPTDQPWTFGGSKGVRPGLVTRGNFRVIAHNKGRVVISASRNSNATFLSNSIVKSLTCL